MAVVLIIDDSPTELHLFQTMLEKAGFDTLVADSGEEGVRRAQDSAAGLHLDGRRNARHERFSGNSKVDQRSSDRCDPGHHHNKQRSGNRQDLGHATGCRRIFG